MTSLILGDIILSTYALCHIRSILTLLKVCREPGCGAAVIQEDLNALNKVGGVGSELHEIRILITFKIKIYIF